MVTQQQVVGVTSPGCTQPVLRLEVLCLEVLQQLLVAEMAPALSVLHQVMVRVRVWMWDKVLLVVVRLQQEQGLPAVVQPE